MKLFGYSTTLAIQGKDCLVQKFRNSSVMLEPPHYRPKVKLEHTRLVGTQGLTQA